MGEFLTGRTRLQQTDRKRIWKLLDNELFKADDGSILLAPRTMYTDNYTIPQELAWIAGSPVDFDTRCSHIHDAQCYWHLALFTTLTEEELKEKGFLRYSAKNRMWVCEDIPVEYLSYKKVGKFKANNILYECMKAADVPLINRLVIRAGVALNLNWYIYPLIGKILPLELDRIYCEDYWREYIGIESVADLLIRFYNFLKRILQIC